MKIKGTEHLPQFIYQYRLFGLIEVAYSKDNAYAFPVARCWKDKFMWSARYGNHKLA